MISYRKGGLSLTLLWWAEIWLLLPFTSGKNRRPRQLLPCFYSRVFPHKSLISFYSGSRGFTYPCLQYVYMYVLGWDARACACPHGKAGRRYHPVSPSAPFLWSNPVGAPHSTGVIGYLRTMSDPVVTWVLGSRLKVIVVCMLNTFNHSAISPGPHNWCFPHLYIIWVGTHVPWCAWGGKKTIFLRFIYFYYVYSVLSARTPAG